MESQAVTLRCEPQLVCSLQPLKQADLQYPSSELNQFPMKYMNTYFWSPKCKGSISMAPVSRSQAYCRLCGQQHGSSLRHVLSDKMMLCASDSHWACERGRKRHLLQLHQLMSIQRCLFKWSRVLYCVPWDTENTAAALCESMDFWRKLCGERKWNYFKTSLMCGALHLHLLCLGIYCNSVSKLVLTWTVFAEEFKVSIDTHFPFAVSLLRGQGQHLPLSSSQFRLLLSSEWHFIFFTV